MCINVNKLNVCINVNKLRECIDVNKLCVIMDVNKPHTNNKTFTHITLVYKCLLLHNYCHL